MCGDHGQARSNLQNIKGSPPHVRGPLRKYFSFLRSMGITPACAGTTIGNYPVKYGRRDHPRMCGDHFLLSLPHIFGKGSPPHVRGPLGILTGQEYEQGITPACAGTTIIIICYIPTIRDHPRMCGDHNILPIFGLFLMGSPPHVRGPQLFERLGDEQFGITPACAGTTSFRFFRQ